MGKVVSASDMFWGYLAQGLNVGIGLVLLPVAIRYLTPEEMGLWYVFFALASFAKLLECGLQPTIARHTSYIYSAAIELVPRGIPRLGESIDWKLLAELIGASRYLYRLIAVLAFFLMVFVGGGYVLTLTNDRSVVCAWFVFALSSAFHLYFGYMSSVLQGQNRIAEVNKIQSITQGVLICSCVPMLIFDFGLLSLSLSSLMSTCVNRILTWRALSSQISKKLECYSFVLSSKSLFKLLIESSWRLGAVQLGDFLILRSNIFIASSFLGLEVAAALGVAQQILLVLTNGSALLMNLQLPKMTMAQLSKNYKLLCEMYSTAMIGAVILYGVGSTIILLGENLIFSLLGTTHMLSSNMLFFYAIIQFLVMIHSMSAIFLTTRNEVPFLKSSLLTGLLIVFLSMLNTKVFGMGVFGLLISQGISQLLFNNWYWPVMALRSLSLNLNGMFYLGVNGLGKMFKS